MSTKTGAEALVLGFIIFVRTTSIRAYDVDGIEFCPLNFLPMVDSNWNSFPTANDEDAIMSPKVTFEIDAVLEPGENVLEVSVEGGAPCIAVCTVISQRCYTISTTRLSIFSAMQAYPITIHFDAYGLYRAVCRIKNKGRCSWYNCRGSCLPLPPFWTQKAQACCPSEFTGTCTARVVRYTGAPSHC